MSAVATTTYEPKPGTVAYRAIAWLEEQPVGTEVTSAKWAEGLGIGTANLIVGVSDAVLHGVLERYTKHGQAKPFFYRLPKGALHRQPHASSPVEKPEVPLPAPRFETLIDAGPRVAGQAADAAATRLKKPGGPSHWRPSPPPMMSPPAAPKDVKAYVAAIAEHTPPDPQPAPALPKGQLRFACWDTGEFAFERGDTVVDVFTSDEANRLIAFVLRVAGRAG